MQNKEREMKYEKPVIIKEEQIELQQLIAACGLSSGGGIDCSTDPDAY